MFLVPEAHHWLSPWAEWVHQQVLIHIKVSMTHMCLIWLLCDFCVLFLKKGTFYKFPDCMHWECIFKLFFTMFTIRQGPGRPYHRSPWSLHRPASRQGEIALADGKSRHGEVYHSSASGQEQRLGKGASNYDRVLMDPTQAHLIDHLTIILPLHPIRIRSLY